MVIVKNSMADDLKAAGGKRSGSQDAIAFSKPVLPVETAGDDVGDGDIIRDEYEGNRAYEMLRGEEAETAAAAPEGRKEMDEEYGIEETDEKGTDDGGVSETVFDLDRAERSGDGDDDPASTDFSGDERIPESAELPKVMKQKMVIAVLLVVALLAVAYATMHDEGGNDVGSYSVAAGSLFGEDLSGVTNEKDIARIRNLTTVAKLVMLHHLEEKADLPISENYIKLNESNPVTDLFKMALKKYGKSEDLLLDPRNPGFYYTFQSSDGINVEFTAQLEDLESERCAGKDPCLFKLVLIEADVEEMNRNLDLYKQSL